MPLPRLLILITGLTIILGMTIWLVTSLYRLYIQISFTAPLLANLLLLLILTLLGLLIAAFIYYLNLSSYQPPRKTSQYQKIAARLPQQKTEAAEETLKAIRKQLTQIQDEVAKEALLQRSREIEASLMRGELRVVVFGTGSSGKTSLVNALIGRMLGDVSPTIGTTKVGETYRLNLRKVNRDILITDTPGILEAGEAGSQRGEVARQLATEADLLLFVVDNDLRESEYEPLEALAQIGKRSILVFNKTDLYTEEDVEVITARLRTRVKDFILASDVVAICAFPQPVPLKNGTMVQPEPEIIVLIKRLAEVLRSEGEDLIADNILLQSQRLGVEARQTIDLERKREADQIIDRYQWIGAGVIACTPLPVLDMLATAAVNAQMVVEIGKVYGCELNSDRGKELALSLGKTLVSLGVVKGAVQLLAGVLQLNITTLIVGKAIQGVTAAYLTRIAGKSFIEYFRHDQDWGDGGITEVVQRQFQLSKKDEFVKAFVKDAIAKVVQPLSSKIELETEEIEEYNEWENYVKSNDDW